MIEPDHLANIPQGGEGRRYAFLNKFYYVSIAFKENHLPRRHTTGRYAFLIESYYVSIALNKITYLAHIPQGGRGAGMRF